MASKLLGSPLSFLQQQLPNSPIDHSLQALQDWWMEIGEPISHDIDRLAPPTLQHYDVSGNRIDELQQHSGYQALLKKGYEDGVIARMFQQNDVLPFFERVYLHSYFDPGIAQVFTGSLITALALQKYTPTDQHIRYLSPLLKTDGTHWQGALWTTERAGGSDPGSNIHTLAKKTDQWLLRGEKFMASNPTADIALVLARPAQLPSSNQALTLFAVPRRNDLKTLNFNIESLIPTIGLRSATPSNIHFHDSEAILLDDLGTGYELMREFKNISRVSHSLSCMALAQRCIYEAAQYANDRTVFGSPALEQPLMKQQFRHRMSVLHAGFKLVWEAVEMLNSVWRLKPPYSERYQLFNLLTHLARYWSAEFAAQTAKWSMEVQATHGLTKPSTIERRLRDAMTLLATDGTAHRQILHSIKLLQDRNVFDALFEHIKPHVAADAHDKMFQRVEQFLQQPIARQEETAEPLIKELSWFIARSLIRKNQQVSPAE